MPADVLEKFPMILFGVYKPKIVIISTPNAEYNIHFPNLNYGASNATYRHWVRQIMLYSIGSSVRVDPGGISKLVSIIQALMNWSLHVARLYDYKVTFHSIGYSMSKSELDVGGCTQIAVFKTSSQSNEYEKCNLNVEESYQHISTIEYPYFEENNFTEIDIVDAIVCYCKDRYRKEILWKPEMSLERFQIGMKEVWDNLEIRQKCKTYERLEWAIRTESGTGKFKSVNDDKIECLFDIPFLHSESFTLHETSEIIPFEELCINSTDVVFEGWGQAESDHNSFKEATGW